MSPGEVLVAIMNSPLDFALARDAHWYRIPVTSVDKWLVDRWPPQYLAFYHTKVFGPEAFAVHYYARVLAVHTRTRAQLFPDQPRDERAGRLYQQLMLGPLQRLPKPIVSRRWRRITFIPTTWDKFWLAAEINDLYDDSPLEDRLWAEFKRRRIVAERQEWIEVSGQPYALDFAIYCAGGKLAVETDGDTWHSDPARIPLDNRRDNDLETEGWSLLRFNTRQINEELASYCAPTVVDKINKLGGLDEGYHRVPRRVDLDGPARQLGLFDVDEGE